MIVLLGGGIGAAKLIEGFYKILPPEELFVVMNTGDDQYFYNLRVCPDIDILFYTLAGMVDRAKKWGRANDSFACLSSLKQLYGGNQTWFNLGDKDFATHIYRTDLLSQGYRLTEVCQLLAEKFGLKGTFVPMSDDFVPTLMHTETETFTFQEWFVQHLTAPVVKKITYDNAEKARPSPGILKALKEAQKIVICPSNPYVSIFPMLAIPGIKSAIKDRKKDVVAVSPLIGGRAVKGPLAKMLEWFDLPRESFSIAQLYQDLLGTFVIDTQDQKELPKFKANGFAVENAPILLNNMKKKCALAEFVLNLPQKA